MKRYFLCFVLAIFAIFNVCKAGGDDTSLPLPISDGNNTKGTPHRTPVHTDIYGVFCSSTSTLLLYVSEDMEVEEVQIYKNGALAYTDTMPFVENGILTYFFSAGGSYQIKASIVGGDVYIGTFSF